MKTITGTFPFGAQLQKLVQRERSPRRVFVLGVYASAVHAQWVDPEGNCLVGALIVASEPGIFWDGSGAEAILAPIAIPPAAGRLTTAAPNLNGPSGRSLDAEYLGPLGASRHDAWLCDLVPYCCMNRSQAAAIEREYEPRRVRLGLPDVTLPGVPETFADDERRNEILAEIEEANPEVLVLLGDHPIREFLASFDQRRARLSDFGTTPDAYGRLHEVTLGSRRLRVLPLVHPRQASGLGSHSASLRELHSNWKQRVAPGLLS